MGGLRVAHATKGGAIMDTTKFTKRDNLNIVFTAFEAAKVPLGNQLIKIDRDPALIYEADLADTFTRLKDFDSQARTLFSHHEHFIDTINSCTPWYSNPGNEPNQVRSSRVIAARFVGIERMEVMILHFDSSGRVVERVNSHSLLPLS